MINKYKKIVIKIGSSSIINESNKKIKNETKYEYENIDTEKNVKVLYFLIFICLIIVFVIKWHYHKYYFNY